MSLMRQTGSGASRSFSEIQGLRRSLDRVYARIRQRARAEWEQHHLDADPSDACVSVRIRDGHQRLLA